MLWRAKLKGTIENHTFGRITSLYAIDKDATAFIPVQIYSADSAELLFDASNEYKNVGILSVSYNKAVQKIRTVLHQNSYLLGISRNFIMLFSFKAGVKNR
jgi:hypothetical protein